MSNTKTNQETKKISYISIPNEILLDEKISVKSKYLYLVLKSLSVSDIVNIKLSTLKEYLNISNNRTIKKQLDELKLSEYVYYDFDRFPNHKPIKITLCSSDTNFTIIDRELFNQVKEDYSYKALLLLYVIEFYYNDEWKYACPSITQIQEVVKWSNKELKETLKEFHKRKICAFCQGDRKDDEGLVRFRNRYLPNVKYYDFITGRTKRRYVKQKTKNDFFK